MSGYLAGPTALGAAFDDARRWADDLALDGPDVRVTAHLKTVKEARELADDPDDIEEWADVLICLAGVAAQQRWTDEELAAAVRVKTAKNEARTWALTSDGTWQHVSADRTNSTTSEQRKAS